MGTMRKGFSGTTKKDTWIKNQGGGFGQGREVGLAGVEGWGENATTVTEQQ